MSIVGNTHGGANNEHSAIIVRKLLGCTEDNVRRGEKITIQY